MGQAIKMVMDTNDEFEYIQPNNQDVYQTFKELIQMVNDAISNEIVGGTLLFSGGQGGSYSLSNTHEAVSSLKTKADLKDIERFVNTFLIPQLRRLGLVPNKECYFEFQYEEYLTMGARSSIDAQLLPYYKFSKEYIEQTYKVKIDEDMTEEANGTSTTETSTDDNVQK
jgi:phage gp29-like protein